jgi:phosphatidylinositol alpha 1,6-mannosyltransferase
MRVAVFTDMDLDAMNGVTTRLRALVRWAPNDVRPRIYTSSAIDIDEPDFLGARAVGLPIDDRGGVRMYLPPVRGFERHIVHDDVRVIHLTTPGPAGLAARYLARRAALPLVGSIHGGLLPLTGGTARARYAAALAGAYLRRLYSSCDRVLVPSAEAVDVLAARGWDRERLLVWPSGVDTHWFSPTHRSQTLRESWHVGEKRPAILYVGSLARDRGLSAIEPISALLHNHRIAHRFIVVGDGPMRSEISDRCPDAVVTGTLSPHALAVVMASADLFFYPRDSGAGGAGGAAVLEAQASGLPAVVVQGSGGNGGNAQVRHDATGFACRAGDVAGFAARIMELITNAEKRRRFGEAARRSALSKSWVTSLAPIYELYRTAALGHDPGSVRDRSSTLPPLNRAAGRRA